MVTELETMLLVMDGPFPIPVVATCIGSMVSCSFHSHCLIVRHVSHIVP